MAVCSGGAVEGIERVGGGEEGQWEVDSCRMNWVVVLKDVSGYGYGACVVSRESSCYSSSASCAMSLERDCRWRGRTGSGDVP